MIFAPNLGGRDGDIWYYLFVALAVFIAYLVEAWEKIGNAIWPRPPRPYIDVWNRDPKRSSK